MQTLSIALPVGIFCAVVMGLFVRFNVLTVTVQGSSMIPTLSDGDRVLVWRWWPKRWLRHGQLVMMFGSTVPRESPAASRVSASRDPSFLIKRVFGLPGDAFPEENLDLNRPPADLGLIRVRSATQSGDTWCIPPGHAFLRGDNPENSADSRTLGLFPLENMVGIVLTRRSRG